MKNCPGVFTIAAHLNNTIILTQTPVSSGGNGTLTSPVLPLIMYLDTATVMCDLEICHHYAINQIGCI